MKCIGEKLDASCPKTPSGEGLGNDSDDIEPAVRFPFRAECQPGFSGPGNLPLFSWRYSFCGLSFCC